MPQNSKSQLRAHFRKLRASFSTQEIEKSSRAAYQLFLKVLSTRRFSSLFLYAPIHNELPTSAIFQWAQANKIECFYPRVEGPTEMNFHLIKDLSELVPSPWGWDAPPSSTHEPDSRSLILTPALAIDQRGHRLGYGKGFYDRYFSDKPQGMRLGYCLNECLSAQDFPHSPQDQRLHAAVCPSGFWQFRSY